MDTLIFIAVLSVLILVHEWGHFITAVKLGVRVEQFALGFGQKLYSFFKNGTEFRLCLIPLGGYVKMAGDERSKCEGKSDEFFSKSVGHRGLIVLMGPVVNIIFAFFCFWVVFLVGFPDMDQTYKRIDAKVGDVLADSPAQKAGLKLNDKILEINGEKIANWPDMQDHIIDSKTPQLEFLVERDGQSVTLMVTPQIYKQTDIFGRHHEVRRVGVAPSKIDKPEEMVIVRLGPIESLGRAAQEMWDITSKTYQGLYEMAIGLRSPKEAMGIVGIFFVIKYASSIGFAFLLHIVGVISLSLAIFNLLPIIPLDGGHLLLLGLEKLRGRPLSAKSEDMVMRLGFSFIILLALFIFYVDFERIGLIDRLTNIWHRIVP
jgi:regulator of sigma E protease